LVAATMLVVDPVAGVGMGVGVAVLFFLIRMSRSVVRRTYHGDTVRSRRARAPRRMELLAERGRQIVVFELEGPIFFGTAEVFALGLARVPPVLLREAGWPGAVGVGFRVPLLMISRVPSGVETLEPGLGSLDKTMWPSRCAQWPDCRVRSSIGPPGEARPTSV